MTDATLRLGALAIVAAGCLALAAWVLRRRIARIGTVGRRPDRVLVEDALKQIHEAEYRGNPSTLQSLAGSVAISGEKASGLVAWMEAHGLIRTDGEMLRPTVAGREYALQVLRAHRLWERHLADETGIAEVAWHTLAERREHELTPEQAEALSARLGHPRYDPHGDPIPTASGGIPGRGAVLPLNALEIGRPARIVHIEDEPTAVYERIAAAGLHAGMDLMVKEATPERIAFVAEGEARFLAPVLAANVSVEELPADERFDAASAAERLSGLALGQSAEILSVSRACRGLERRRLMDLGIVPGTRVEAVMRSPSGDPTAYRIRGATIALRRQQADFIRVRRAVPMGAA